MIGIEVNKSSDYLCGEKHFGNLGEKVTSDSMFAVTEFTCFFEVCCFESEALLYADALCESIVFIGVSSSNSYINLFRMVVRQAGSSALSLSSYRSIFILYWYSLDRTPGDNTFITSASLCLLRNVTCFMFCKTLLLFFRWGRTP